MDNEFLLDVRDLKMYFQKDVGVIRKKIRNIKAVDGVSFQIKKGETFGLVGESGCGKSTTGYSLVRLYEPTSGEIIYKGVDIAKLSREEMMPYRKSIQMIFQDPYSSLNPRMTVADIIGEPLDIHKLYDNKKEREEKIKNLLEIVSLNDDHASRYPHEFSGGQRQRVGIARALAVNPEFIVCDEPISALDVSIQAQIINMLEQLQEDFGLTYLFIAHDLSMVRHISDRVGVMYLGKIVEIGETEEIYNRHLHPYTEALLSAVPVVDPKLGKDSKAIVLEGEIPSPLDEITGCRFKSRCNRKTDICEKIDPELRQVGSDYFVACHNI